MIRVKDAAAIWVRLAKCYGLVLREVRNGQGSLTLPQFDVMAQLLRRPRGMSMGELSVALLVTKGNVTGLVRRLASRGLVRARPGGDRRVRVLRLTRAGLRLARREVAAHERRLRRILAAAAIRESLGRLRHVLAERRTR